MHTYRPALALVLSASLLAGTALPTAAQLCPPAPAPPPVDNRDGYLPMFEEAPIHPIEMNAAGTELWVANIPDSSVSIFRIGSTGLLTYQADIEVGLGPVSIRQRPGSAEMWIVCQSSNAVFVFNQSTRRLIDTVRTAFEPAGLVFDASGTTAFVTLSASNQVARINAATKTLLVPTVEVLSNMPAGSGSSSLAHVEEPRSLLVEGNDLFVLSHRSGNGSMRDRFDLNGNGDVFDIFNVWQLANVLPPDRDVLRLDLGNPANPGSAVLWRLGTLNFDLKRGANGDLYVSTVDLHNDTTTKKFQYRANGFSTHAVVHALPSTNGLPQASTTTVDLNLAANIHPALQASFRCAVPNEMALSSAGTELYVSCYETRNTAVLDLASDTVIGNLQQNTAGGFGPRGVVLNDAQGRAYVYNRADNTVSVFNMIGAAGQTQNPVQTLSAGFDITPPALLAGRRHMIDASNSASGVESCNTCHIDGSLDGLAWDLGDATGDLQANPFPRDFNGIKMTMDLRGIEETPIYHWQGNRNDLTDFNAAFAGLLGGSMLSPTDFADFQSFIFALSYPPNPKHGTVAPTQPPRTYSAAALTGWDCFNTQVAHVVSNDLTEIQTGVPTKSLTCIECHGMDGASGTNNQVNNDVAGLLAEDATQLRGMFDKESDTVFYGAIPLAATGFGFSSVALVQTIRQFLDFFPAFSPTQKDRTTDFLTELDSGMAPSTAFVHTLTQATAGSLAPITGYLMPEVTAGNSELVARGWMMLGSPVAVPTPISMLFDPTIPPAGAFRTDRTSPATLTLAQISTSLQASGGAMAFLGVPVGSGWRLGRDRDMDQLLDGDEARFGASVLSADTDGDGFPDGYETRFGFQPGNSASFPPPGIDLVAPTISSPTVSWVNSRVAKVRWNTNEEATSRVRIVDVATGATVYDATEAQLKTRHVMVARNLSPNGTFDVLIDSTDPANPANTTSLILAGGAVTQPHLFQSLHVASTSLAVTGAVCQVPPGTMCFSVLTASFTVRDESDAPVQGATVQARFLEWIPGGGNQPVQNQATGTSGANGVATVSFVTATPIGSGARGEVMTNLSMGANTVTETSPLQRLYFHPLDGEFGFWSQIVLP